MKPGMLVTVSAPHMATVTGPIKCISETRLIVADSPCTALVLTKDLNFSTTQWLYSKRPVAVTVTSPKPFIVRVQAALKRAKQVKK